MLLEGISQAIEQEVTMGAVVLGIVGQRLQPPLIAKPVEPGPSPGAVVEQAVQVGAHHARPLRTGSPPTQTRVAAQGLKTGIRCGGSVVQFKSAQRRLHGPEAIDASLAQPFRAAEGGLQGQKSQSGLGPPLVCAF